MTQTEETTSTQTHFAPKLFGIVLIVGVLVIGGLWSMSRYVTTDLARDLHHWNEKLDLIAESRNADVAGYVQQHFKDMHSLAENPSMQLYLTELKDLPKTEKKSVGEQMAEPAQLSYLRNLIVFTAERSGYTSPSGMSSIPANVQSSTSSGGMGLLNASGDLVVSTQMPEEMKEALLEHAKSQSGTDEKFIDITRSKSGSLYMGFVVPVFSIQGDRDEDSLVGKIVGLKVLDDGFFHLLKHPGTTEQTLEAVLVRRNGDRVEFLSPLQDNIAPLSKEMDFNTRKLAEAKLIEESNGFSSELNDYDNKKVLATSRAVSGTPWTLIVKADRAEALKASTERRNGMIAVFFLILAVVVLVISAIWWYGSSKRSLMMSYYYRRLANQSMAQEKLLQLIADNIPESIAITDNQQHYLFANKSAAYEAGMQTEHMVGKSLQDVLGTARAAEIAQLSADCIDKNQLLQQTILREGNSGARTIRASFVPLEQIPVGIDKEQASGALVVEQDITEVVHEREKRIKINQDLINTMLMIVDRRDPYAANHSVIVSELALHIASDMGLDEVTRETVRIAASVMNLGKIVVPKAVLTKTGALTDAEKKVVHDSLSDAAELVKHIHFDGPVYDTLRQWQEKWDGSGPMGIKGDAILLSARILAVANSFIGMVSPRSWRDALSLEEATKFLMNNCDTLFDRRVVAALVHFLENHHGKEWLASVTAKKQAA